MWIISMKILIKASLIDFLLQGCLLLDQSTFSQDLKECLRVAKTLWHRGDDCFLECNSVRYAGRISRADPDHLETHFRDPTLNRGNEAACGTETPAVKDDLVAAERDPDTVPLPDNGGPSRAKRRKKTTAEDSYPLCVLHHSDPLKGVLE